MNADGKTHNPTLYTYRVEVSNKPGLPDVAGAALLAQLPSLGIPAASRVRTGTLYQIIGHLSHSQIQTAARELLADPVTQEHFLHGDGLNGMRPGSGWRIEVWLRPSVSDPVGESVRDAFAAIGLPRPDSARCGTLCDVYGRLGRAHAEKVALKLLANPVIHQFSIVPQ